MISKTIFKSVLLMCKIFVAICRWQTERICSKIMNGLKESSGRLIFLNQMKHFFLCAGLRFNFFCYIFFFHLNITEIVFRAIRIFSLVFAIFFLLFLFSTIFVLLMKLIGHLGFSVKKNIFLPFLIFRLIK